MDYSDYLKGTQQILHRSQQETFPYLVSVLGREFVVYENVFSPKYFKDTEIFAKNLVVQPGEHLLEIGAGTGVVAITKALEGAGRVVATDINHEAVKNIRDNAMRHKVLGMVDVREGNLFQTIHEGEQFDVIFWNTPFGLIERSNYTVLEKAVFDPHYRSTYLFLTEGPRYLKPNGRLVIGFSSTLGKLRRVKNYCKGAGLTLKLVHQEKSEEIYPVYFEIFEARK